jgi:hypothetical protein
MVLVKNWFNACLLIANYKNGIESWTEKSKQTMLINSFLENSVRTRKYVSNRTILHLHKLYITTINSSNAINFHVFKHNIINV